MSALQTSTHDGTVPHTAATDEQPLSLDDLYGEGTAESLQAADGFAAATMEALLKMSETANELLARMGVVVTAADEAAAEAFVDAALGEGEGEWTEIAVEDLPPALEAEVSALRGMGNGSATPHANAMSSSDDESTSSSDDDDDEAVGGRMGTFFQKNLSRAPQAGSDDAAVASPAAEAPASASCSNEAADDANNTALGGDAAVVVEFASLSGLPSDEPPRPSLHHATAAASFLAAATVSLQPRPNETRAELMRREEKAMLDNCAAALVGELAEGVEEEGEEEEEVKGKEEVQRSVHVDPSATDTHTELPDTQPLHTDKQQRIKQQPPPRSSNPHSFANAMRDCDDLTVRDPIVSRAEALDTSRFPTHVSDETRGACLDALKLIMAQYGGGGK